MYNIILSLICQSSLIRNKYLKQKYDFKLTQQKNVCCVTQHIINQHFHLYFNSVIGHMNVKRACTLYRQKKNLSSNANCIAVSENFHHIAKNGSTLLQSFQSRQTFPFEHNDAFPNNTPPALQMNFQFDSMCIKILCVGHKNSVSFSQIAHLLKLLIGT